MMRNLAVVTWLALVVAIGSAQQNRLPQEEAQAYARPCAERAALLNDLQLPIEVDTDKPCAERGEGGGAMVIPDKRLSEQALLRAGKGVIPVGQLWFRKWTLVVQGKATPNSQLRIVSVNLDGTDRPMPLFLLGVRKGAQGLELAIYALDSEPLLVLPLQKLDLGQNLPIELEWKRGDNNAATLTLSLLGKYQTILTVTGQAD